MIEHQIHDDVDAVFLAFDEFLKILHSAKFWVSRGVVHIVASSQHLEKDKWGEPDGVDAQFLKVINLLMIPAGRQSRQHLNQQRNGGKSDR